MKNKWSILSISFMLMISVCTVGCMNKQQTKEEIYDDFKDQISNISSYTCTANVEAVPFVIDNVVFEREVSQAPFI